MLPSININITNGNLPQPEIPLENEVGMVVHADSLIGWAFRTFTASDQVPVGTSITVSAAINEFYLNAPRGTRLHVWLVPDTMLYSDMVAEAALLAQALNYKIRTILLMPLPNAGYTPFIINGMDANVYDAAGAAQLLGDTLTYNYHAPISFLLKGFAFTGAATALFDFRNGTDEYNRVGIVIGDDYEAVIALSRIATMPVQRNIGRVRSGAIKNDGKQAIAGVPVALYAELALIHELGYISLRKHDGLAGVYFNNDQLCAPTTDDYNTLVRRRTIDKAYDITYRVMVQNLLDELYIDGAGKIQGSLIKHWQQQVENAIFENMTAKGELSADVSIPNDKGVVFYIDPTQTVSPTSDITATLRVRPVGSLEQMTVDLGFALNLTQTP